MIHETNFVASITGGALIGIAAVVLMLFNGRIAGISGILKGSLKPKSGDWLWRLCFLAGLAIAPVGYKIVTSHDIAVTLTASPSLLIIAGTLVGIGTSIGNGCTSGHGVCGIARFSTRSLIATASFMTVAALTVFLTK